MGKLLHALIIEDSEDDAQLVLRELRHIGYEVEFERVETAEAMQAVLPEKAWDLVLSDYTMPKFNALQALEVLKASHPDLPFIIISGTIGEETAVTALKAGANDFLVKGKFDRLGPAIEHELREAEIRRAHRQAKQALQTSEELFGTAFQHSPVGICITTLDGKLQNVSQSLADMLGRATAELERKHFNDITHPDDLEIGEVAVGRMLAGKILSVSFEKRYLHKSGEPIWALVSSSLLRDASGQPVHFITHILNMTERKQAEQSLLASEVRYRRLFESAKDGILILNADAGEIVDVNPFLIEMVGYSHTELLGKQLWEIGFFKDIVASKAAFLKLQEERYIRYENLPLETKDGRRIWVEFVSNAYDVNGKQVIQCNIRDITARKRAEEQTQLQLQRLKALRAIDIAISSSFDLRLTLDILLDQVIAQLKTDAAAILLFQPITRTLEHGASRGFRSTSIRDARLRLGEGYAGKAIIERRMIHISNLTDTDSEFSRALLLKDEDFHDYYCVPLIVKGDVKGVLEIFHRSALAGSAEWLDFLETLAGQAAIAIDSASLFEDLQHSNSELFQAYDTTIEGWSHALDLRDKETEGHSLRVTEITLELARKFGFTDEELRHIRWGALLHDIGKMGIPDNILLKPDKLTDKEWEIMKQHPVFAFEMLSPIAYLKSSLDIPYCHHEKWDGTGYPRGLKGEVIPLAARLFAVVDVWDALRSDRPYRKAWTREKTLEHIKSLSGIHFDHKVVEYFLNLIERSNG